VLPWAQQLAKSVFPQQQVFGPQIVLNMFPQQVSSEFLQLQPPIANLKLEHSKKKFLPIVSTTTNLSSVTTNSRLETSKTRLIFSTTELLVTYSICFVTIKYLRHRDRQFVAQDMSNL
jgi:hypothetical protein